MRDMVTKAGNSTDTRTVKNRQNGFDYIKGIASIAVVLIHYNFPGNTGIAIKAFCRFSVPVFLCVSGYFFLKEGVMNEVSAVKKIRHILALLFGASVFYLIFTLMWNMQMNDIWDRKQFALDKLRAGRIVKFFLTNDPFVYSHLWFLPSLLYCYFFAMLYFTSSKRIKTIYILAPLLLTGYAVLQEFGGMGAIKTSISIPGTEDKIWLYNLFFFRTLPFFLFGMIFRENQQKISELMLSDSVWTWIIALLGGGIAIVERFLFGEAQFFIGNYITVAAMFTWAMQSRVHANNPICFIGRELSLSIYIFHIAVGKCFDLFAKKNHLWGTFFANYGRAPLVLIGSLTIAYMIYKAQFLYKHRST